MQKAYLRGKRKPLEITSINTKQWIDDLKNINTQKGKSNA